MPDWQPPDGSRPFRLPGDFDMYEGPSLPGVDMVDQSQVHHQDQRAERSRSALEQFPWSAMQAKSGVQSGAIHSSSAVSYFRRCEVACIPTGKVAATREAVLKVGAVVIARAAAAGAVAAVEAAAVVAVAAEVVAGWDEYCSAAERCSPEYTVSQSVTAI